MSRSKSVSYICKNCKADTVCEFHTWYDGKIYKDYVHKPERVIEGRRTWKRKQRFPWWSIKSFINGPPRWWWQEKHSGARAKYRQMMFRSDDPALPRERDIINLYGWY